MSGVPRSHETGPQSATGAGSEAGAQTGALTGPKTGATNGPPTKNRVAVTGATGHIGIAVLKALAQRDASVTIVHRRGSDLRPAAGLYEKAVVCSLHDVSGLAAAFDSCDTVFHLAGRISLGGEARPRTERRLLHKTNVHGAGAVFAACREAGVRRLVVVSSVEALPLGRCHNNKELNEATAIVPEETLLEYGRTKAAAVKLIERAKAAEEAAAEEDARTEVCFVFPTAVIGPDDYRPSATGRLISDYLKRRLPAYVSGGFDFVDVRDVAEVICRAAELGVDGGRYIAAGHYTTLDTVMDLLEASSGIKPPPRLPRRFVLSLSPLAEMFSRAFGTTPRLTRGSLRLLGTGRCVDARKTFEALEHSPRPLEQTIKDTVRWFQDRERGGGAPPRGGSR